MAKKTTARKKTSKKKTAKKTAAKKPASKKRTTKKAAYGKRTDYNAPVDDYFDQIEDPTLKASAETFRRLVKKAVPKAEPAIKWGKPMWTDPIFLCAVAAFKKHVTLQFFDAGTSIKDPKNLLQGTGKACRHVKSTSPDDIDEKAVIALIKDAHEFNNAMAEKGSM